MTACFSIHSQDTSKIIITSEQLRTTNLIFAEHKEYSKLVPLLRQENTNLQLLNYSWQITDSIKTVHLYKKNEIIAQQDVTIEKLEKDIKTYSSVCCCVTGISVIITVLCLLMN